MDNHINPNCQIAQVFLQPLLLSERLAHQKTKHSLAIPLNLLDAPGGLGFAGTLWFTVLQHLCYCTMMGQQFTKSRNSSFGLSTHGCAHHHTFMTGKCCASWCQAIWHVRLGRVSCKQQLPKCLLGVSRLSWRRLGL